MKHSVFVAGLLAIGISAAIAQSNVVDQRQGLMKEMGAQARTLGGMLRGQVPFDQAKAQASLGVIAENSQKAVHLFPESSKGVEKTKALPAVWEDRTKFEALLAKLNQDARTAKGAVKDEASLKAAVPAVLQNCGACHDAFREKST